MKKIFLGLLFIAMTINSLAQEIEYKTFIYTDPGLAEELYALNATTERSFGSDILDATLNATKGIASGWVTSFVDMGISAVASLATINSRHKAEWDSMIQKENVSETKLSTLSNLNDFYKSPSFSGSMDPKGMVFNGIGCLRTEDNDTTLYISCHIDKRKLSRIINHSKFELILDTLIINPLKSNLPNTTLDVPFTFTERKNYNLNMTISIISSWINSVASLQKDQLLGEFTINLLINKTDIDANSYFKYIRNEDEKPEYQITGESFIVPRSYMGYRDEYDNYHDSWGTGEYKVSVVIKETCDVTQEYIKNWKKDYKKRKKMQTTENVFNRNWKTIQNQSWDEITQTWIITTMKAPANVLTNTMNEKMGYNPAGIPKSN